jgi:hypothetical protein
MTGFHIFLLNFIGIWNIMFCKKVQVIPLPENILIRVINFHYKYSLKTRDVYHIQFLFNISKKNIMHIDKRQIEDKIIGFLLKRTFFGVSS